MAAEKKKPSAIIVFGGGFLALCVSFVVYGTLFTEDRHAPSGTPPSAPPASVEQPVLYEPPLDALLKDESLPRAIAATKPLMQDSHNEINLGAARLALWSMRHLTWDDLQDLPASSIGLAMKDSWQERGKRLCGRGEILEIQVDRSEYGVGHMGGMFMDPNLHLIRFYAVGSTGGLVADSQATFCGVLAGRQSYDDTGGGVTVAPTVVGMFKLPENLVGRQPSPTGSATRRTIPGAKVLKEKKYDTPGFRRADIWVSVPRDTTASQLTTFLKQLYEEQMARKDFARGPVNAVRASVFLDGVDWKDGWDNWVGRISIGSGPDNGPVFDNRLVDASLVDQVKAIVGVDVATVATDGGVRVTYSVDEISPFGEQRSREDVADMVLFLVTHFPAKVYDQVGSLDVFEQMVVYQGKTIGTVRLTRELFDGWNYHAKMEEIMKAQDVVTEAREAGEITSAQADARYKKIEVAVNRGLLKQLPAGSVEIDKKYRR